MKRARAAFAVALTLALALLLPAALRRDRDFSGDEAAKISEAYYLRAHPDWFVNALERTNPPIGKWLFGVVIRMRGDPVPETPALEWRGEEGRYVPPPGREAAYRRALRPLRAVSAVAMALLLALIAAMAFARGGWLAAGIAFLLLWRHFLITTLASVATFDAIQVLMLTSAVVLARWPPASGSLVALAFQTRLNGILGLVPALFATRTKKHALLLAATCIIVSIAVSPYYWVSGPHAGIIERLRWQFHDIRAVIHTMDPALISDTVGEKLPFFARTVASGLAGKAIVAGALLALFSRRREALIAWSNALLFALWLPLLWQRYVFPALPLLAWLAALGFSDAAARARESVRRRTAPTRSAVPASRPESPV